MFSPSVTSVVKSAQVGPAQRSIRKPSSLFETSFHARSTWSAEIVVAVRPVEAAGR